MFCSNCGKEIRDNSNFCPYCGVVKRAIPSETARQTLIQDASVATKQNRVKGFWRRKSSEEKHDMVRLLLFLLLIVCLVAYDMIKHRYLNEYINVGIETDLKNDSSRFAGESICVEGWVKWSTDDWIFCISERPSSDSDWVIVDGSGVSGKIPKDGTAVAVCGDWGFNERFGHCLKAYKMDFLDEESSILLEKYQTISATSLLKNPDTYIGKCVQVTGEVSRAASGAFMVGETTSASGVWVDGQVDKRHAVNGEQVTVYGVVTGGGDFTDIKIMLDVIEFAD